MAIIAGNIYTSEFEFRKGRLDFQDGIIKDIVFDDVESAIFDETKSDSLVEEKSFDLLKEKDEAVYIIPGLVDIHMHGCKGIDFCNATPEDFAEIAEYEILHGITSVCPSTMTLSADKLKQVCSNFAKYAHESFLGINLEGPFINKKKCGAQNEEHVIAFDGELLSCLDELAGNVIKLVTVAPECEGCLEGIKSYSDRFVFSLGHSLADYETAIKAFDNGANHVTHLYNAMSAFNHRDVGIYGAALDSEAFVEIIADGYHIHPSAVRNTVKAFGDDKVIMISDSCEATGCMDGKYMLGDMPIIKSGERAVLAEDEKTLAGSVLNLYDCFTKAVKQMKIPLESAVRMATYNPAKSIGMEDRIGRLAKGCMANFLVLDKDLNILEVVYKGEKIK